MINAFLYSVIINQTVFSQMLKEICATTNEGSNLNNPLSTGQVRLCKGWGKGWGILTLGGVRMENPIYHRQQRLSSVVHLNWNFPAFTLTSQKPVCHRAVKELTQTDCSVIYQVITVHGLKKKTVELLNIQQLCRPHLNKPTLQIFFVFWKIQLLFPAVQSISSVPSTFTF